MKILSSSWWEKNKYRCRSSFNYALTGRKQTRSVY